MKTLFAQSRCPTFPWTTLVCLLILALIMAACGQSSPSAQSSSSHPQTTAPTSSPSPLATPASSTSLQVKVTEVRGSNGGKNHYSFSPAILKVNVGDIVTFVNESDASHALISTSAGGITGGGILDVNETQAAEFLKPGSFTISSQQHPEAKLAATVGGSSGGVLPPQTVVLSQKHGAKASYFFDLSAIGNPTNIGVSPGDGLLIVNQTNETQILTITPTNGVVEGSIIDPNEAQLIQFSAEENYTVSMKDHPEATIMVISD